MTVFKSDLAQAMTAMWISGISIFAVLNVLNYKGTVKGQSRSDSLLLSPYHWAKLFRGVVAIVAVPMRFAMIC